jgi:hypothetical protein
LFLQEGSVNLLWLAAGVILGMILGNFTRWQVMRGAARAIQRAPIEERDLILKIIRREMANWLFREDPERYSLICSRAEILEEEVARMDNKIKTANFVLLADEFPFDLMGINEYALYSDNFDRRGIEGVEDNYLKVVKYQSLVADANKSFSYLKPTRNFNSETLNKYIERYKDAILLKNLKDVVEKYDWYRSGKFPEYVKIPWETGQFIIQYVPDFAERRLGIKLKKTNEFGIYSIFIDDNDKIYKQFYKCSDTFENESLLNENDILI